MGGLAQKMEWPQVPASGRQGSGTICMSCSTICDTGSHILVAVCSVNTARREVSVPVVENSCGVVDDELELEPSAVQLFGGVVPLSLLEVPPAQAWLVHLPLADNPCMYRNTSAYNFEQSVLVYYTLDTIWKVLLSVGLVGGRQALQVLAPGLSLQEVQLLQVSSRLPLANNPYRYHRTSAGNSG